jgi:hypothetical protein
LPFFSPIFFFLVAEKSCRWPFDNFSQSQRRRIRRFLFRCFHFSLAASLQMFCVTDEKSSLLLAVRAESHLTCLAKQHLNHQPGRVEQNSKWKELKNRK